MGDLLRNIGKVKLVGQYGMRGRRPLYRMRVSDPVKSKWRQHRHGRAQIESREWIDPRRLVVVGWE